MTAMGMPSSPSDATEAHPYLLEPYCRMTDVEKVAFLVSLQAEVDSNSSAERDIFDALPESEAACIREALTDEEFQMLLGSTVHEAFNASDALASCITDEGYVDIFVAITNDQGGGLSDDTLSCVETFAREHPHYVALINPASYDMTAMSPSDISEIADDGLRMLNCYTPEELERVQQVSTGALAQ